MKILQKTDIDFLAMKGKFIVASALVMLVGLVSLIAKGGPNFGIDFTGGTNIIYGFASKPDEDRIRKIAEGAKLKVDVQRFDKPEKNQLLLRVPQEKVEGRDVSGDVTKALTAALFPSAGSQFDLNLNGVDALQNLLVSADPEKVAERPNDDPKVVYGRAAQAIIAARSEKGLFASAEEASKTPGLSPVVADHIKAHTVAGPFTLLNAESVGPQVGKDLRRKGTWAVILSWAAMLGYIAFRFRSGAFGTAAVVALIHDTWVTLGICSLVNTEISLTVVAAFLTLIGYSVNDTVVVFDRIRENVPKMRKQPLATVINVSINQTLARTLLTSILTFLVVVALFVLGGAVLRGFSFVLLIGLIVGCYSTIFIAAPLIVTWEEWKARREGKGSPAPAVAKAR